MHVRPVLSASSQLLSAVEVRDGDLSAGLAQLAAWHLERLRVPRVIVALAGPPDPAAIAAELEAAGLTGDRLALALPESWLDEPGMREGLGAVRERTGVQAIVADFGSGSHPEVDFLVDYPADAICLAPRIAAGVAGEGPAAERVREVSTVANELGWRVIAAEVATAEERSALACVGVAEVAGPGVGPFEDAAELGRLLARMRVTLPPAPEPSRRAPAAPRAASPLAATGAPAVTATAPDAEPHRYHPYNEPAMRNRLTDSAAESGSAPTPPTTRGSPGRSQPPRQQPAGQQEARRFRVLPLLVLLILIALAVYAVLIWQDYVENPLNGLI
ncbi:MAG: EAL domain-containing protein [Solirubrobacterales bacterium]